MMLKSRLTFWPLLNSITFLLFLLSISLHAQRYAFDSANSTISFSIEHLGFLTVTGSFQKFTGTVKFTKDSVAVMATIHTNSITTKNDDRDVIIKGEQYLNVTVFPIIQIEAKGKQKNNKIVTNCWVTIRGKESRWPVTFSVRKMNNNQKLIEGKFTLHREKLMLSFGAMNDLIGDDITIQTSAMLELKQ